MSNNDQHRLIVERLLASKAIDFTAIGKTLGEVGPSLALSDFEDEGFCGTMRTFLRVFLLSPYRTLEIPSLNNPNKGEKLLENLEELNSNTGELR